jgi:hypothetical protein
MHMRTLAPAALVILALAASGCGLLETNDDELETLRVEIIQLREDFMDLEAEVSLLARVPATTTAASSSATATTAAPATTTTRATSSGTSSSDEAPAATVPVGLNEDAILTATYNWGPSDPALILQAMLGITSDGWYGNGTRAAHLAELEARGLDTDGVPSPPTTTTEASAETTTEAPADTTTTEAPADTTTTEAPAETTTTAAPAETTTTAAPAETTTTAAG